MDLLMSIGSYFIVGAACMIVGAALGNFSAHVDYERTKRARSK